MRTAFKKSGLLGPVFTTPFVLLSLVFGNAAWAVDGQPPLVTPNVASAPSPIPSAPVAVNSVMPPSQPSAMGDENKDDNAGKSIMDINTKAPDAVKELVKRLESKNGDFSLDDLNSARQAVTKIEALIDIEKHLAELEKVRQDREGKSLASAIPASALMPKTPQFQPMPMPMPVAPMPVAFPSVATSIEVNRISGVDGRYTASVKMADGSAKTLQVGDHVSDSEVVSRIDAEGVEFTQNGSKHFVHIKNVGTVFGGTL